MKKYILVLVLVFMPFVTKASFDSNIRYGTKNSDNVKEIQEFLTDQQVYSGPITGNFYSLTLSGIKAFQKREGIKADGYWGPATRSKANDLLSVEIGEGQENAFQTGENLPLSNNESAFKFADGSSFNFNGKSLEPPTSVPQADFCFNIPGNQLILPSNLYRYDDNNCYNVPQYTGSNIAVTPPVVVAPVQPTPIAPSLNVQCQADIKELQQYITDIQTKLITDEDNLTGQGRGIPNSIIQGQKSKLEAAANRQIQLIQIKINDKINSCN